MSDFWWHEIDEKYLAIVAKYYPTLKVPGYGNSGPNFHFDLSHIYKSYKNTPYYYAGKKEFIHWTSISNLFSVINNGEIRLYNLWNSEDNKEFEFAAKLLSLTTKQIAYLKERYFIASFCEVGNLGSDYLWQKYGKNYQGVAIHFEIINSIDEAENFILSKVYYEVPHVFRKFNNEVLALKAEYKNAYNFEFENWRFAGFYKRSTYIQEKEIRLALIAPFNSTMDYLRFTREELKINKRRNRVVAYFPLKLWTDPESSYYASLGVKVPSQTNPFQFTQQAQPQLKIKSIYFGENALSNQEYGTFHGKLSEIINWRLGYKVDLPLNTFKKK